MTFNLTEVVVVVHDIEISNLGNFLGLLITNQK